MERNWGCACHSINPGNIRAEVKQRAERQTAVEHNVGLNFIGLMQSWQFNIYSNSKAVYTGGVCGCLFYFCSITKKFLVKLNTNGEG